MGDLIDFLLARLDEDEQRAREAASANPGSAATQWSAEKVDYQDWRGWRKVWAVRPARVEGIDLAICKSDILPKVATHIARHDPARVLRDVEANRQIVDECAKYLGGEDNELMWHAARLARRTLLYLAQRHADHDCYQEEWRL